MIQLSPVRSNPRNDFKLNKFDNWFAVDHCELDGAKGSDGPKTLVMSTITSHQHRKGLRSEDESSRDAAIAVQVMQALRESGYPLHGVRCFCDEESIVLRGRVTRYFYAQMALEISRQFADDRRIDIRISTIPAKI